MPPTSQTLATPDAVLAANIQAPELDANSNDLPPQADRDILPVVGIGGSAGAIKPLQKFFEAMAPDSGLAFVVVLHLAPDAESALPQIIQARTTMPVVQVLGPTLVEPNHVYVIPPGRHLAMRDGCLLLCDPEQARGKRVAVDLFFRSLAASQRSRAVAVVLSGLDSDGAVGIKRIKEEGGVTIAQDPEEAEHDGMPRSALETGMVDWVLPIDAMPAKLLEFIRNELSLRFPEPEAQAPRQNADEGALREILAILLARTGHDFTHYKRPTILRRIGRRLQVNSLPDFPLYAAFLRSHSGEAAALLQDLLISVTNFFRDKEAFEALEAEIPRLFQHKSPGDTIRAWVPGCATGEEAYSLAMLLQEHAETLPTPPQIQIFATDIDENATGAAREGLYPAAIAADVSPERLKRFFTSQQGRYRVKKELREMILFASHNLLKDSPFSRLDLVSCRNLLIYFDISAQERALGLFHFALRPGGLLLLGSSEAADDEAALFAPLSKKHRVFECRPNAHPRFLPLAPPPQNRASNLLSASGPIAIPTIGSVPFVPPALPAPPRERAASSFGELHLQLLEQYAAPSVLVNDSYEVVHLSERASRYLSLAPGEISINLLAMVHPALRLELRSALFRAMQNGEQADVSAVPVEIGGETRPVDLHVRPMRDPNLPPRAAPRFLLVIFDEGQAQVLAAAGGAEGPASLQLEEEQSHLKSHLRETVEQYEAAGEELRANNEELQAMNEELRATGEELETSKEEIQAANEELSTLNQELRSKVEEISRANADLHNLMSSTDIATIFLDRQLRIQRYTPRALDLFHIIPTDRGRPLSDLRHGLCDDSFHEDAEQVLETLRPTEREVSTCENGAPSRHFILRALPYRTLEDKIDGVVLTFLDITERKQAELTRLQESLRAETQRSAEILEGLGDLGDLFYALDAGFCFTYVNARLARAWGRGRDEMIGRHFWSEFPQVVGSEPYQAHLRAMQERQPTEFEGPSAITGRWISASFRPSADGGLLVYLRDLHEQREAEQARRQSEETLRIAVESSDLGTWDWNVETDEVQWNEQHFLLFGMKPSPSPQHPQVFADHLHEEDHARVMQELERVVEGQGVFKSEFRIVREGDRAVRWMSGYGRTVQSREGRTTRMIGVVFDATERHHADEVLRRSHQELEQRVRERTHDLARVNLALESQVAERKRAEAGRELLLRRLVSAQEEERRRISRELHDQMGQTLTAMMMGLKSLPDFPETGLSPPSPNETIARLQHITTELMNEVHHLAWDLRPAVLDNLGLEAALNQHVAEWSRRSDTRADFLSHGTGGERLPEHIENALYRTVQEALTNVARHAQATHASVLLERVEDEVVAIVEDNGVGFDVEAVGDGGGRLGLAGMRERVEIVGGTLTIESSPGAGTTVYARVPIKA